MSHHTTWCHTTTDCGASLQIAATCTKPLMKCNEVPEWSWMLFQPMHAYHAQHAQVPIRAMRDAEQISSRSLRERVLDICWSSLRSQVHMFTLKWHEITTKSTLQRRPAKCRTHVGVATSLSNLSILVHQTDFGKVLSRRAWFVFMLRM